MTQPKKSNIEQHIENHLLTYHKLYLTIILLLIALIPIIQNITTHQPLIRGDESYYHLTQSLTAPWYDLPHLTLHFLQRHLPLSTLIIIPLVLSLVTLHLSLKTLEHLNIPKKQNALFHLFLIITPAFMYTLTTLSSYSLYFFLLALGFYTLTSTQNLAFKQKKTTPLSLSHILSLISFFTIIFFDVWQIFFTLALLLLYYYSLNHNQNNNQRISTTHNQPQTESVQNITNFFQIILTIVGIIFLLKIFGASTLSESLIAGPFYLQNHWNDFLSDFGSVAGISIFLAILGFIGFILTRKQKQTFYSSLLFGLICLTLYFWHTQITIIFAIMIAYLSSIAFLHLLQRQWTIPPLKNFTLFIILLGLIFSTTTYLLRVNDLNPSAQDISSLTWISQTYPLTELNKLTAPQQKIFSLPENGNYIKYYTHITPLSTLQSVPQIQNISQSILDSSYITQLFPLLEEQNITLMYITTQMRQTLPSNQNVLFLLKNERFKLVHTSENNEVWEFHPEPIKTTILPPKK